MLDQYICKKSMNIIDAMRVIDKNSAGLVYVVDDRRVLVGCLTDGDIRRWIISGGNLTATVDQAMNHTPQYVDQKSSVEGIKKMKKNRISSVAVVNDEGQILDVMFLQSHIRLLNQGDKKALKGTAVIIMAGGKGTRLYPYTKILPKPLIPIGDIPILERILNRFSEYGAEDFYLTVNYKREMIKSYFSETTHAYQLHYIEEEEPRGTAGSIRLIHKKFDSSVIVTNCDTLIMEDYGGVLDYHRETGNDLTIVSSMKSTVIPYGVLQSKEKGLVTSMEEKPRFSYLINTGMYVIEPEFLNWIPKEKVFHMTDLAEKMMRENKQVGTYPISEDSFLDMGEFEELKRMEERINSGYVE